MSVTPLMDSSNSSSGIMSPSQVASREEVRQLRPRPAAIDLHDLEQVIRNFYRICLSLVFLQVFIFGVFMGYVR
jgi:hypothetical protein